MKSTGIVRKVDELGRIVIPKETRRLLNISERDPLEIMIDGDMVILQKHIESCSICGKTKRLRAIENLKLCPDCIKRIAGLAD